jgi:hypothetical protein
VRDLTFSRARAVAKAAYIFTFPLVMNYGNIYRQAIDPSTSGGGFGTWRHHHLHECAAGSGSQGRRDVLQSSICLDLRSEPWWCTVGQVGPNVSFVGRLVDLWGFVLEDFGAVDRASSPVLVAAPMTIRDVPEEIERIVRGESAFVVLSTETRWRDPDEHPGLEPVRPDIVLEPVSVHLGRGAPRPAPDLTWWPCTDDVATTDEFWSCANFALSLTTSHPDDRSILERISEIGVVSGQAWEESASQEEILEAVREGMDDALSDLLSAAGESGSRPGNFRRAEMDCDYFGRALGAVRSMDRIRP